MTHYGNSTDHIYKQKKKRSTKKYKKKQSTKTTHRATQSTKKYIEQHNRKKYIEQCNEKDYIQKDNSLTRKTSVCAPYFRGIQWHLPYNWGEKHGKISVRLAEECHLVRWKQNIQHRIYITKENKYDSNSKNYYLNRCVKLYILQFNTLISKRG